MTLCLDNSIFDKTPEVPDAADVCLVPGRSSVADIAHKCFFSCDVSIDGVSVQHGQVLIWMELTSGA